MKYQQIGRGIVKRSATRQLGLFIDGTGLDRAARRLNRKVDLNALVRGVTSGANIVVSRYYTLIPYEDDSRQRAFLDAVERAGLQVVVKRLPPKGVSRQVGVEIEMAADIVAFSLGHFNFGDLGSYKSLQPPVTGSALPGSVPFGSHRRNRQEKPAEGPNNTGNPEEVATKQPVDLQRIVTIVCPGRDLNYAIARANEIGAETITADFGKFNSGDLLKSAAKWIDLSDSETIWRD